MRITASGAFVIVDGPQIAETEVRATMKVVNELLSEAKAEAARILQTARDQADVIVRAAEKKQQTMLNDARAKLAAIGG